MLATDLDALTEHSSRLQQQYAELDAIVDALVRHGGQDMDAINVRITAIKQTEELLRPLRDHFCQSKESMPAAVQESTQATIDIIKGLMPKLAQLEKDTAAAAQRLYPKVQQSVRAVQMQTAYGNESRNA
jgi:hypothetical protein